MTSIDESITIFKSELTELKARAAKEISAAQMMMEDLRKVSEENIKRADVAEAVQLSMQVTLLIYMNQTS